MYENRYLFYSHRISCRIESKFFLLDQFTSTWFKTNTAFTFLSSFAFISVQDALGIGHSEINGPVLFVLRVNAFFFWYFMVVLMKIIAHLHRYLD